jgi:hypothetical protein
MFGRIFVYKIAEKILIYKGKNINYQSKYMFWLGKKCPIEANIICISSNINCARHNLAAQLALNNIHLLTHLNVLCGMT